MDHGHIRSWLRYFSLVSSFKRRWYSTNRVLYLLQANIHLILVKIVADLKGNKLIPSLFFGR